MDASSPSAAAPKRSFKDALVTPTTPALGEGNGEAPEVAPLYPSATASASPATEGTKKKRPAGTAPKKTEAADGAKAEPKPKRIFAEMPKPKVKKGGRVAMRAEAEKEAAAAAAKDTNKKVKKMKKPKKKEMEYDEALYGAEEDREMVPFNYTAPKPRVITEALFLWELVAAFSEPYMVLRLEHLCQDVATLLQQSRKANHLMQRYWNAQWAKMVWEPSEVTTEKRLLLPSSLTRSEGKINWKKMYKEEYPLWQQRTFAGVGSNNNAINMARVLFKQETLNENKSAKELARSELTVEEALLKAQRKRGMEVEVDNEGSDKESVDGAAGGTSRHGGGGSGGGPAGKPIRLRVPVHDPSAGFTRADYKQNYRQGTRKGKHMKGGDKKWGSYAALDDDDDFY